jgi:hypothetical protein
MSLVNVVTTPCRPVEDIGLRLAMNAIWWAYLDTKDLGSSVQARQMDIIAHVNPRYAPTYITDGNQPDT